MSNQHLVPVKSPYADVTLDPSTSLPGIIAEEVMNESYGATNNETDSTSNTEIENDPNDGYLLPFNQTIMVLIPLYLLVFLASLDSTILSTLMTDIASDLNAIPYISWIATAYLFSTSIVSPLGKLSDIFGRKPSLLLCISVFTIGCLQCATSNSVLSFTSGRFLSGFAAGLNTLSTITTSDLVPLRNRGVYQGLGNVFFAVGSAVGGTCGGWIAQNWGWRMAFWCQVPIGITCFIIIVVFFNLPKLPHEIGNENVKLSDKFKKVDVLGILLIAFNLLILIIMSGTHLNNKLYSLLLLVSLVIGLYYLYQVESTHPYAIIPTSLMKDRSVLGASLANWFGTMYSYILIYYFPVYLTTVLDITSEGVGIRLIPNIFASSASSLLSGFYMKWSGKYRTFLITFNLFGVVGIIILLSRTYPGITPTLFEQFTLNTVALSAYASMLTVTLLSLIAAVPIEHQSSVTSIQYAFRSVGSTLGTSFSSYIFTNSLSYYLNNKLTNNKPIDVDEITLNKIINTALHDAKYIRSIDAPKWAVGLMIESYNISVWYTFVFSLIACIGGSIAAIMVRDSKLHTSVKR